VQELTTRDQMKETERRFTESKRLEDRSLAHTRRLFSYYVMGISVNEPVDPLFVLGLSPIYA
jgi:hypothetical protein